MSCTKNSYLDSKVSQKNAAKKPAKYYLGPAIFRASMSGAVLD